MSKKKKILVLTGGGDAPGLNAVIRAVVKHAIGTYGWEVIGSQVAFNGILEDPMRIMPLDLKTVSGLLVRGGTILGTINQGGPFTFPVKNEKGVLVEIDRSDELLARLRRLGIDAVINIGGDGSQRISQKLFEKGLNIVGVPKTIDNDLDCTEMTFGFQTAVETATDAIDKLHATAESHDRVMVLELMGRDAGWIAMASGIAGGADVVLIPEIPFDLDKVADHIRARDARGHHFAIVVVAEGAKPKDGDAFVKEKAGVGRNNRVLGGVGDYVTRELAKKLGGMETRCTVLGHLQRGGVPAPMDRLLATRFGAAAVDLVAQEKFGYMVAYQQDNIVPVKIADAIQRYRTIAPDHNLVKTARALGISLGD
ncbi:ATP-dependent 6-phosphofructokinase [bacterium]|nr:ATP-dependent 6-phosphofructokinase [bacterium]